MNKDYIIKMAQEAGFGNYAYEARTMFERFFHMAQAAEREACSKLADEADRYNRHISREIAAAIRARGNQ